MLKKRQTETNYYLHTKPTNRCNGFTTLSIPKSLLYCHQRTLLELNRCTKLDVHHHHLQRMPRLVHLDRRSWRTLFCDAVSSTYVSCSSRTSLAAELPYKKARNEASTQMACPIKSLRREDEDDRNYLLASGN